LTKTLDEAGMVKVDKGYEGNRPRVEGNRTRVE
jgi:hypothetical protein